jgi:hypothetical protein
VTFERFGALTADIALKGLIAGSSLMFGAFIARRLVLRLEANVFRVVREGIMRVAGSVRKPGSDAAGWLMQPAACFHHSSQLTLRICTDSKPNQARRVIDEFADAATPRKDKVNVSERSGSL